MSDQNESCSIQLHSFLSRKHSVWRMDIYCYQMNTKTIIYAAFQNPFSLLAVLSIDNVYENHWNHVKSFLQIAIRFQWTISKQTTDTCTPEKIHWTAIRRHYYPIAPVPVYSIYNFILHNLDWNHVKRQREK